MDIKTKIGLRIKEIRNEKNEFMKQFEIKPLEIFLMIDQPFTCPHCGTRCMEIGSFYHTNAKLLIDQCLNQDCGFICGEEEDEEFLNTL